MLTNAVAVMNNKGGARKTSFAMNMAGLLARSGWRVCLVEADTQSNLADYLGVSDLSDEGEDFADAVRKGGTVTPVNVRPNVDAVFCGDEFIGVENEVIELRRRGRGVENALAPLAEEYDLILIDCSPHEGQLNNVIMETVHYVALTSEGNSGARKGIRNMALSIAQKRDINPDLSIIGIALIGLAKNSPKRTQKVIDLLNGDVEGTPVPVFESFVRLLPSGAGEIEDAGLLAQEALEAVEDAQRTRLARLAGSDTASHSASVNPIEGVSPASVRGLVADYKALAAEFGDEFLRRQDDYHAEAVNA